MAIPFVAPSRPRFIHPWQRVTILDRGFDEIGGGLNAIVARVRERGTLWADIGDAATCERYEPAPTQSFVFEPRRKLLPCPKRDKRPKAKKRPSKPVVVAPPAPPSFAEQYWAEHAIRAAEAAVEAARKRPAVGKVFHVNKPENPWHGVPFTALEIREGFGKLGAHEEPGTFVGFNLNGTVVWARLSECDF